MLIVQYKPTSDLVAIADSNIKAVAEEFLDCISTFERKVVVISQVLMIDGIRAVVVEKNIDPSLIVIEVYNEDDELMESVSITDTYTLTSWNSLPQVQINFLKTTIKAGKYDPNK